MARSWHYPPWRRIVMQVSLCVILAATLGLAMLVSHRKMAVKLSTSRTAGNLGARLPVGWVLERENLPPVMFEVREMVSNRPGRVMTIRCEQVQPGTSTLKYLKESSLLHETTEVLGTEEPSPIRIAGVPGLLVHRRQEVQSDDDNQPMSYPVWIATGVLPSGQAISVSLVCPIEIDPEADKTIVTNTAEGITDHR